MSKFPGVRQLFRVLACALLGLIGLSILILISFPDAANRDFVSYWAAGRLLVQHRKPYDVPAVREIEQGAGLNATETVRDLQRNIEVKVPKVFLVRNLPLFLFFVLPLGYLSFHFSVAAWSLSILAAMVSSIHLLRRGDPRDRTHLFGYLFVPTMACLFAGQTGMFLLLGLTVFFRFQDDPRRNVRLAAGAGLTVLLFKPHLFVVLAIPLFGWILLRRRTDLLAGFGIAAAVLQLPLLWFRPAIWQDYLAMLRASGIDQEMIPTLGSALRFLTGVPAAQMLPVACGAFWIAWYFWKKRDKWSWEDHGLIALLVSVLVAPYAWMTDEVVLLPAIFAGLYRSEKSLRWFAALNGIALIEFLASFTMGSGAYCWTPLAWLLWFLAGRPGGLGSLWKTSAAPTERVLAEPVNGDIR